MRALAVRQPWADQIVAGEKTLEFRSWDTKYRGEVLIVASSHDSGLWLPFDADNGEVIHLPLPTGCHICVVNLKHTRPMTRQDAKDYGFRYTAGQYAWEIELLYPVLPVPHKAKLNLYTIPDEEIERMPDGDSWADYDYPNRNKKPPKSGFEDI
ncbi:MAG: ASCH domain-containing protein [Pseudomonadota bacterium]|nr:ASCH domain-containing protein [Pseudomonadota bacterium]